MLRPFFNDATVPRDALIFVPSLFNSCDDELHLDYDGHGRDLDSDSEYGEYHGGGGICPTPGGSSPTHSRATQGTGCGQDTFSDGELQEVPVVGHRTCA